MSKTNLGIKIVSLIMLGAVVTAIPLLQLTSKTAVSMPESIRIPPVVEHGPGDPPDPALFPHWQHNDFRCYACHPSLFPQNKMGFTHEDMDAGEYCGACHNGTLAFSPDDDDIECEKCHVER